MIKNLFNIDTASRNQYNEIGQVTAKTIGGGLQTVDYKYNIRGWLTDINNPENMGNDLFGMKLHYNTLPSGMSGTTQFNGNIAAMVWRSAITNVTRSYNFSYDNLSRITNATYAEGSNYALNKGMYNESVNKYDNNGNIIDLVRRGILPDKRIATIDSLHYAYLNGGNQIKYIEDNANDTIGFIDKNNPSAAAEYAYDENGNMTRDDNKGIVKLTYNNLNLPDTIFLKTGQMIKYIYTTSGVKLSKITTDRDVKITTDYNGQFVYTDKALAYIIFDEGLIHARSDTSYWYEYFLKDHLGNTRITFTDSAGIARSLQESHYYPFGMTFGGIPQKQTGNKYLYNGKELQPEFGLDWYDYGARMYDATAPHFTTIDPKAEMNYSVSPYAYCQNNPIIRIDPDGQLDDINIYNSPTDKDPVVVLKTNKIEANVYLSDKALPADVLKGPTLTFDIDKFIPDETPDAFVASIGVMAGAGGGFTGSIDIAMMNKGEDAGKIFTYGTFGPGVGAGAGIGISFGTCDYNESSGVPFNKSIFTGTSREITGSIGPISETRVTGFADGEFHLPFSNATKSYESHLFGVGDGTPASFGIYKTNTDYISEAGKFILKSMK